MNPLKIEQEQQDGQVVLRLQGIFDVSTAQGLRRSVQSIDEEGDVVLDFSKVSHFADVAVAVLTQGLDRAAGKVAVRGVGGHQRTMFRYFGVPTD